MPGCTSKARTCPGATAREAPTIPPCCATRTPPSSPNGRPDNPLWAQPNYLAGSGASLDQCVRWACTAGGLGISDTLAMATANPAALTGLSDRAALRAGRRADLVQFERTPGGGIGRLLTTVVDGVVRVRDGDRV